MTGLEVLACVFLIWGLTTRIVMSTAAFLKSDDESTGFRIVFTLSVFFLGNNLAAILFVASLFKDEDNRDQIIKDIRNLEYAFRSDKPKTITFNKKDYEISGRLYREIGLILNKHLTSK